MSDASEVADKIIEGISEKLDKPKDEIGRDKSLQNDLGADSLDMVEMMMDLEDEFDLVVPEEEAQKLVTVGDAIKYVEKRLANKDG